KLLTGHINYKKLHEVSFSNALIWAKVLEVNAACPPGSKYSLIQLHQMVAKDPSLPDLDDEAKVQLKDELWWHQAKKGTSICTTNAAAMCDVHAIMDRIIQDLDGLAMQTGIYAALFVTRGHFYNMHSAMWYGTDNAMNFWEDVLKLELYQVAKQFELWGCSQNKSKLCFTIKLKHGINKKGWPKTVPFTSPCSIPNVKLIHQLQDTLRTNQCYFVKMSSWEHQDFMKDLKVHQESGEIVKPSCKK
ncbi:hypothetical protein J3A83DRAFT_4074323, partial [Scleroderma citrinum]